MKFLNTLFACVFVFCVSAFVCPSPGAAAEANAEFVSHVQTFDDWEVAVVKRRNIDFIRMSTKMTGTQTVFEIMINYRNRPEEPRITYIFTRIVEPGLYKLPDEVKKVASFILDEVIYPVDLSTREIGKTGIYTSIVVDPPENLLDLIRATKVLMFRFVSGIVYNIPMKGFDAAMRYVDELRRNYIR